MRNTAREWKFMIPLLVLALVLIGADMWYFGAPSGAALRGDAPAEAACGYDPEKPGIDDVQRLVNPKDPYVGNPEAPVTVIEYFDPNCPHCKNFHPVMKQVISAYSEAARFVYKPIALPGWDFSVPQVMALYAAAEEGKFLMMLDEQFKRQKRGGLSMQELREIASLIGMDPDALEERVRSRQDEDYMISQRQMAGSIGLTGVPSVLINGKFVNSRAPECIGTLIEQAAE